MTGGSDAVPVSAIAIPPGELAALVASRRTSLLIGLDVDGVLAPIVARADRAALLPGVDDVVERLARRVPVAVVSGRSVEDLITRYGFRPPVMVVGSHGLQRGDRSDVALDDTERRRLGQLVELADAAVSQAGDGAWLEHKPASVVLHVRQADPDPASGAVAALVEAAAGVDGAHVKRGHEVVELMARATSKAVAMAELRRECDAETMVFVGDDDTDEEVFRSFTPNDVGVRVGPGATAARYRLDEPAAVLEWLERLDTALDLPVE